MTVNGVEMPDGVVRVLYAQAPTTALRGRLGTGDRTGNLPEAMFHKNIKKTKTKKTTTDFYRNKQINFKK